MKLSTKNTKNVSLVLVQIVGLLRQLINSPNWMVKMPWKPEAQGLCLSTDWATSSIARCCMESCSDEPLDASDAID